MGSSKGGFPFATDAGEDISWPTTEIDPLAADVDSPVSKNSRLKPALSTTTLPKHAFNLLKYSVT